MAKTKKIEKLRGETSYLNVTDGIHEVWGMGDKKSIQDVLFKINELVDAVNKLSK